MKKVSHPPCRSDTHPCFGFATGSVCSVPVLGCIVTRKWGTGREKTKAIIQASREATRGWMGLLIFLEQPSGQVRNNQESGASLLGDDQTWKHGRVLRLISFRLPPSHAWGQGWVSGLKKNLEALESQGYKTHRRSPRGATVPCTGPHPVVALLVNTGFSLLSLFCAGDNYLNINLSPKLRYLSGPDIEFLRNNCQTRDS
jgi:hypothetical protein